MVAVCTLQGVQDSEPYRQDSYTAALGDAFRFLLVRRTLEALTSAGGNVDDAGLDL